MRIRSALLIFVIAFGVAGMAAIAAFSMIRNAPFVGFSDATTMLHQIGEYRNWTKVNPQPQRMDIAVALLCSIPPPSRRRISSPESPHDTAYISVYVNPVGRKAMLTEAAPKFPVGSIIVKEKLKTIRSHEPELLTVMVKREAGYDSTRGDWEYLVVDGGVSEIKARGKLKSCQGCHLERENNDYIFRTYLPPDVVEALN